MAALPRPVCCSAGAACHASPSATGASEDGTDVAVDPASISHVLRAMGVPVEFAAGTLRLSVGRMTTDEEVDSAADHIAAVVAAALASRPAAV